MPHPSSSLALRTLISDDGRLDLFLEEVEIPKPIEDQIVLRVDAAPINPSDLLLLTGPADIGTIQARGSADTRRVTMQVPAHSMASVRARLGVPMTPGNEGSGVVVDAGPDARHFLGKLVAVGGGSMFAQHRTARARDALVLPEDVTAVQSAACFVNPLTTLAMIETMKQEGHTAIVHTAAASNLGQMLQRLCLKDGIGLVNIVRNPAQAEILRSLGAAHVCDSSAVTFRSDLAEAVRRTGATLAFDAVGGGELADDILVAMESALTEGEPYNRYGSPV